MEFLLFLNKENSKRRRYLILFIGCILFITLTVMLAILSNIDRFSSNNSLVKYLFVYRGVLTQTQMLISVYLVLALNKQGYLMTVIMNGISLITSIMAIIRMNSAEPVPGLAAYLATIIILRLIFNYQKQAKDYVNQIDDQKKQLELSEEKLVFRANHDSLTKLYKSDYFLKYLDREIEKARIGKRILGIVFIDLVSFKLSMTLRTFSRR